jgi:O-antigen/teichoic acid export membrane protein
MPSDFGILGMLSILFSLAGMLTDSGFGQALVRKNNADQKDFSTLFFFNVGSSFFIYILLFFSAPLISQFYKDPIFTNITRILALNVIFNSLSNVQFRYCQKNLLFKELSISSIISTLMAGVIAVLAALNGFGLYSLVIQSLITSILKFILLWYSVNWRPTLTFQYSSLKEMSSFSSKLLISGIIDLASKNVLYIIIGKKYSSADVGYLGTARRLQEVPITILTSSLGSVAYPLLSKMQDNIDLLRENYRRIIRSLSFVLFPFLLFLFIDAQQVILILFTEKWIASVPYLKILCILGTFWVFNIISLNVYKVLGKASLYLKLEVIKKLVFFILLFIFIKNQLLFYLVIELSVQIISFIINSIYNNRLIKYTFINQIYDTIPNLFISIFSAIMVYIFNKVTFNLNHSLVLFLDLVLYSATYLTLTSWLNKNQFTELKSIINISNRI